MQKKSFRFKSKVWLWPGFSGWHFVYVDKNISDKIFQAVRDRKILTSRNGLIPIDIKIGNSLWKTSLLPHKKENIYLISIKSSIRKKENIFDGDDVSITFWII